MNLSASPFRLLGQGDLDKVEENYGRVIRAWAEEWFCVESTSLSFVVREPVAAEIVAKEDWTIFGDPSGVWLAAKVSENRQREFVERLLGTPVPPGMALSPLLRDLLDQCIRDLVVRFGARPTVGLSLVRHAATRIDATAVAYGAGALSIQPAAGVALPELVLGGELVERILAREVQPPARMPALARREMSLRAMREQIEVILGDAELTLGDIANVSVGDVIRLQAKYRDPLSVRFCNGVQLLKADLGASGTKKAIQIVGKAT